MPPRIRKAGTVTEDLKQRNRQSAPDTTPPIAVSGLFEVTCAIRETNCPFQEQLEGQTASRDMEVNSSGGGILLPLNLLSSVFKDPVMLRIVGGTGLTYRGPVRVNVVMGPSIEGLFDGAFAADGSSFHVRFELTSLCRIAGTLAGSRK